MTDIKIPNSNEIMRKYIERLNKEIKYYRIADYVEDVLVNNWSIMNDQTIIWANDINDICRDIQAQYKTSQEIIAKYVYAYIKLMEQKWDITKIDQTYDTEGDIKIPGKWIFKPKSSEQENTNDN